jgi:hypothetical protein
MMTEYEPHFDDERTLLSARPVVPLEKIEAKARHRRQWFLGGAFAIAMMLGAASALVASYLKLRNAPQSAAELSVEPEFTIAPVAVAASSPTDTPAVETEDTAVVEEEQPAATPKKESAPKHRAVVVRPEPDPIEDRDKRNMSEHEQLDQIRDAVLYDEWQERRARRATRRERRRAERYNHRDLSNLDEIFEGRRRP